MRNLLLLSVILPVFFFIGLAADERQSEAWYRIEKNNFAYGWRQICKREKTATIGYKKKTATIEYTIKEVCKFRYNELYTNEVSKKIEYVVNKHNLLPLSVAAEIVDSYKTISIKGKVKQGYLQLSISNTKKIPGLENVENIPGLENLNTTEQKKLYVGNAYFDVCLGPMIIKHINLKPLKHFEIKIINLDSCSILSSHIQIFKIDDKKQIKAKINYDDYSTDLLLSKDGVIQLQESQNQKVRLVLVSREQAQKIDFLQIEGLDVTKKSE